MTAIEDQARSVFLAAVERVPEQWPAFLGEACGDNVELRARVEALLHAHQAQGSIHHGANAPAVTVDDVSHPEGPGTVIGPYKLLEQIGEGGFGVVYLAEQAQPVRRKVALKILKPGMDTRQVVARFEAERQALAIMDHPHIAKVFDGGATPSGRPYFVMELVKGVPITEFCDQHHLTPRQRLELFVPVCQAVQHAHQKGIIHRDLKPSNVLVSRHDTTPVVKVIDFGVAKALGQVLTDKTLFTGLAQMIGTPLYMSPEQAGMSDLDVDTRSDIYSLGVLLYELLTGTTPFTKERFKKAAYDEIRRIIREEEPPRPSTRLTESKSALPSISAQRQTEPAKLTKLVRGELDWIVMTALEKDRNRRYDTANGFAADVQRYLAGEPVQAVPPSAAYRLRKFVRRNRAAVLATTGFLLLTWLAASGIYLAYRRAVAAEINAREQAVVASEERQKAVTARKAAERTAVSLQLDLDQSVDVGRHTVLRLAQTLRTIPADDTDLREYAVMAILAAGQRSAPLLSELTHDGQPVTDHKMGLDDRTLLTHGPDGSDRLWDAPTGRLIAILRQGDERVVDAGFSEEGRTVYTVDRSGVIRLWDASTGTYRAATAPRPDRFKLLAKAWPESWLMSKIVQESSVKASGDRILSYGRAIENPGGDTDWIIEPTGPVELWDAQAGKLVARLDRPGLELDSFAFQGKGRWVTCKDTDKNVCVFSATDGREIARLAGAGSVAAVSPTGRWMVTQAGDDHKILRIWETDTWRPDPVVQSLLGSKPVYYLADDLFEYRTPDAEHYLYRHGRPVPMGQFQMGYLSDWGGRIDNLIHNGAGHLFDLQTMRRLVPLRGRRYHPELARFARDGRMVAVYMGGEGEVALWVDTRTDKSFSRSFGGEIYYVRNNQPAGLVNVERGYGISVSLIRTTHLDIDPELLELWAQVSVCGELGPNDEFVKWDEPTWERKRQELAARPLPWPDFPFPGHVAADRLHWLRLAFAEANKADKDRLAAELLRRAEAAGDKAEAVRWRTELGK